MSAHFCGFYRCDEPATRVLENYWGAPSGTLVDVLNNGGVRNAGGVHVIYGSPHAYRCEAHAAQWDSMSWNRTAQSRPLAEVSNG